MLRRVVVVLAFVLPLAAQVPVALTSSMALPSSMAFDSGRNRLVEFAPAGEVFEYEGSLRLHRANASPTGPGPRLLPGLVYDPIRRHVLLFGGYASVALDDTWVWDGTGWRQLTGTRPPSREAPGMTFDSVRGRVVMFGGQARFIGQRQDTWEHDGQTWIQRNPATSPFPPNSPTMCFDSGRGVTVMTLASGALGVPATTWEWNGNNWLQRVTAQGPPTSNGFALAYDPLRQRCVSLGGGNITGSFAVLASPGREIWEYDGTNWVLAATLATPLRRFCAAWFDAGLGVVRVAGGPEPAGDTTLFDLSTWNGAALATTSTTALPTVRGEPMVAGSASGIVMFGGLGNVTSSTSVTPTAFGDTWIWSDRAWQRATTVLSPPARITGAMRYRLLTNTTLLFGGWFNGAVLGDCWEWNGTSWSQLPAGPPARQGAALAEDLGRGEVVMFGGAAGPIFSTAVLADTWVFNGTTWTQRATSGPSARLQAGMAYDVGRGQVILFGGRRGATQADNFADTWSWNGSNWTQVVTPTTPPAITIPSLEYSFARARLILSGTVGNGVEQLWSLGGSDWVRVAEVAGALDSFGRLVGDPLHAPLTYFNGSSVREWSEATATVAASGAGCGVPAPRLSMRARPRTGEPNCGLELETSPGLPMLFAVDVVAANVPLGGGCTVWVAPTSMIFLGVSDSRGLAVLPWVVSQDPALSAIDLFAQAAVADPLQPLGFALSGGVRLRIGD